MQVSIRELKDHLSAYIHRVQSGEIVVISSHRVPVARLVPIVKVEDKTFHALLQIEGLHWNGKKPLGNRNGPSLKGDVMASDYVLKDRR